jgi:hypothetical protein
VFSGEVGTIMFVGQVPVQAFAARTATFANHLPNSNNPKGGGLFIRYPDGILRNLTQEAGFTNVAVREPTVHWDGNKALFSMVTQSNNRWQIYEITGFGRNESPSITLVPNQPNYNNVSPFYGSDDRVLFTSDRPITNMSHHYPPLDEYESSPTVVAIYSLNRGNGNLFVVQHSPSGSFSPFVDSFGRILFIKWDHLIRDQQVYPNGQFQPVTYADESANSPRVTGNDASLEAEVFPEPRFKIGNNMQTPYGTMNEHNFNHFMPWEVNQDGTGELSLNHIGRHELGLSYTHQLFNGDGNLTYNGAPSSVAANNYHVSAPGGMFHMKEDPLTPGRYYFTRAPEFGTASGGDILSLESGVPGVSPEKMVVRAITRVSSVGYARDPLPMSDGRLLASVTTQKGESVQANGAPFRLAVLTASGQQYAVSGLLTNGIPHGNGYLWEIEAVEVTPRSRPPLRTMESVPTIERNVFTQKGVNINQLQSWMAARNLALIVIRDVTSRDRADRQQPFNLRVPGGVSKTPRPGTVYDVSFLQIFQAEYLRGYQMGNMQGRRPLARPIPGNLPAISHNGPEGSVIVATDGSVAAFVPARRALTWQLTDTEGVGIVRERNWVSFQPGEIRSCTSCHGVNDRDQTGQGAPQNQPQALGLLLDYWKQL